MRGRRTVAHAREIDPGFQLFSVCIDHSKARLRDVRGEDEPVVAGDGNALDFSGDRDHGDGPASGHVEYGDGAGPDVGRVAELAVVGERQHVRLCLAGGDFADDLQRGWIDDSDGVVEFGGDIQQAADGIDHREMRADAVAEVDDAGDLFDAEIDDQQLVAVDAGLAHAGVAVNRQEGAVPVLRCGDLMAPLPGDVFGDG